MFLSMLTADAAAQHGHEFSPPRASSPSNSSLLTRSPLSILTPSAWRPTASATPLSLPPGVLKPAASPPDTISKNQKTIMFVEPEEVPIISPEHSRPPSSSSICSSEGKPKKRHSRSKTTYNLAHPPPPTAPRQKLHLRPKVLLQLQQVVPSSRPKPAYEVIPSSVFVPRLARKFARVFKSKDKLGPADILVVKAEDYGPAEDEENSDDERWGNREVIGVVCAGKKDENKTCIKTEILMDDGSSWEASTLPNGGYEFVFTDEHGLKLKCRWVARMSPARRSSGMSGTSQGCLSNPPTEEKKFNFSTISPDSRRHPIIATMTRTSIDVLDYYSMPSASSSIHPPASPIHTPAQTPSAMSDAGPFTEASELAAERSQIKTEDALRNFIIVSGIWVAFCENWSTVFNYARCGTNPTLSTNCHKSRPSGPTRAVSMPTIDTAPTSRSSTPDENRRTLPQLLRNSTQILHRNSPSSTLSPSTPASSAASSPTAAPKTRCRRSNSTGTAFIQRNRSANRTRFGLPLEDQALAESENEREREISAELARSNPASRQLPARAQHRPNPPPIRIAAATPETTPTPSPTPSPTYYEKAYSAQYPVGTTAGLWDSGEPAATRQPRSLIAEGEGQGPEKGAKRKSGRFRRLFGIFRRGSGG